MKQNRCWFEKTIAKGDLLESWVKAATLAGFCVEKWKQISRNGLKINEKGEIFSNRG